MYKSTKHKITKTVTEINDDETFFSHHFLLTTLPKIAGNFILAPFAFELLVVWLLCLLRYSAMCELVFFILGMKDSLELDLLARLSKLPENRLPLGYVFYAGVDDFLLKKLDTDTVGFFIAVGSSLMKSTARSST